jgi:hypothetical protein
LLKQAENRESTGNRARNFEPEFSFERLPHGRGIERNGGPFPLALRTADWPKPAARGIRGAFGSVSWLAGARAQFAVSHFAK